MRSKRRGEAAPPTSSTCHWASGLTRTSSPSPSDNAATTSRSPEAWSTRRARATARGRHRNCAPGGPSSHTSSGCSAMTLSYRSGFAWFRRTGTARRQWAPTPKRSRTPGSRCVHGAAGWRPTATSRPCVWAASPCTRRCRRATTTTARPACSSATGASCGTSSRSCVRTRTACSGSTGRRCGGTTTGSLRPPSPVASHATCRVARLLLRRCCFGGRVVVAARELASQLRERLVAGQRAALRGSCGLGGVGRLLGSRRLGSLRLDDLLLVGFPAGLGGGVLRLPLRLLRLVTRQPLAGLDVEALRVDVVALLVVLRGHAVERRVEVVADGLADRALVGLLQRQRDATALEVDVDDLDEDLVADVDDLLRDLDVTLGQLGDVHQALDALRHADERTERHQLGDPAGHDLADGVGAGEGLPRVFLRRLERQRDPLAVHVDVEHLDGDLLADLDHLGRVVDVLPGQLGDVHETVDAAEVHERAEVDDRGDDALADLALLQLGQEVLANLALGLLEPGAAGQHDVVAVLVELDDLGLERLADERLQVANAAHLNQRCREEATQTDVEDQAEIDDLDDGALDDAVLVLDLLDRAPGAFVLRALLGQDQPALLVI